MNKKGGLNIQGAILDKYQLERYLEKIAADHVLTSRSKSETYPIDRLQDNFNFIKYVYKMLNDHIKLGISIHPAGEWILDNLYIIEETTKSVSKDLSKRKYENFLGISNGKYEGYARIYVLAAEIVAYTDGKIDGNNLKEMLAAYQNKKTLSMDEIWNIGIFLQIALIENIRQICEKIYMSQIQKYKVEAIINKTIENGNDTKNKYNFNNKALLKNQIIKDGKNKYPFVEYMSYRLKKYGKKSFQYLKILEEAVSKSGNSIEEVIKKEHFDVAVRKVSMGNSITSIKKISRINFLEIFESINGVEDILKQDPEKQYDKMDSNSKILYRNTIKEISKKTKFSEIYIARKCLELAQKATGENDDKKKHVGYYLIGGGKDILISIITNKKHISVTNKEKTNLYIEIIWITSVLFSIIISVILYSLLIANMHNGVALFLSLITLVLSILPVENMTTKTIQFALSKIIKPKLIPKLDFSGGIPEEYSTIVVIPTILKTKKQVQELIRKLEVFYIANKSENLYFTLLGDCTSGQNEFEEHDDEVIETGINEIKKLNVKYVDIKFNKFNFIYRKRIWNEKENCYLGWERKRGFLNQFNEYILGNTKNPFRINTIENYKESLGIPKIKYVITLDADTDLTLNSALELVGTMAHILNKPELNKEKDLVTSGHGIIVPRVGITLENSRKSKFTEIYAGQGGTDSYTNAVSDMYQDNFDEGIYSGKGIYDLSIFETVLNGEIRENTVLSHDLLEGCYLRSGYASDIMLMDGYPASYISYKKRLFRWTRGDFQILWWLGNKIKNKNDEVKRNPLTVLSKYKIISNIFRSKQELFNILLIYYSCILSIVLNENFIFITIITILFMIWPFILELVNKIINKNENSVKTKRFTKEIIGLKASFCRTILDISTMPDKAVMALKAEIITLYRMLKAKKNLLEWETSEEVEKKSKNDLNSYYKEMISNVILGITGLVFSIFIGLKFIAFSILIFCISILYLIAPFFMFYLGKKNIEEKEFDKISEKNKIYILDIAYKTWKYFKENLNEKTNYLPPDNYQEDRKPILIKRTSSTNIGLGLLSIIAGYDLKFENLEDTVNILEKVINTVTNLQKWNGHLYNWYNIETLEPLIPKYVSSVDSGNFVGYLYVALQFLEESKEKIKKIKDYENGIEKIDRSIVKEKNIGNQDTLAKIESMIITIQIIIKNTDFTKLYDEQNRLFSVGYNVEENKLTDSYYDLLASEARQTSFVAIAKKDISPKHWNNLSRTLTTLNKYKGLVSWSGTAFEYLMPNINIPKYPGSILDESCKFMIMSQKEYSKKLGVPWGFSEAAFNLKDFNNNYQYKAFGIPWLGLKRGLADEIVVSSYGTILAIDENVTEVLKNMKEFEKYGILGKYGFFESIDFTPTRVKDEYEIVKTYMAHHQGLILLAINNLVNDKILQKRFMKNPEMQALRILLEEKMPDNMVITKEEKEKPQKIKYIDYEDYSTRTYNKVDENLNISNVISNDNYTIVLDQYGNGYSTYKDIQINRFKNTSDEQQGITFFIKDIKNRRIWTNGYCKYLGPPDKYNITFYPDMSKFTRIDGSIETTTKIITANDDPVEIRRLEIKNIGLIEQTLEITGYMEPILSKKMQDYAHPAFNNLFISYEYIDSLGVIIVKRNPRLKNEKIVYMAIKMCSQDESDIDAEFEIDKEKFFGRNNLNIPKAVENSTSLDRKVNRVTDPIVAIKKIINIKTEETKCINIIISVTENKDEAIKNIIKYANNETIKRTFELSKARVEAETRYLGIKGKDIEIYQKILSYLIFKRKVYTKNITISNEKIYPTSTLWKYGISGDLPILLLKIKDINDIDTLKEIINAYEYYKSKNITIDLIILNEEKEKYENYVKDAITSCILNKNLGYLINEKGGIYCLNNINNKSDKELLEEKADVIIVAEDGTLEEQINEQENLIKELTIKNGYDSKKQITEIEKNDDFGQINFNENNFKYYNEYGGFSSDGKEYVIKVNKNNKLPTVWSHVITNKNFGTVVTESMGGYTWNYNSKLNRLTAWNNNQVADIPSEIIYIKDMDTDKKWSLGLNPMPDDNDYYVTYGFGYATYQHECSMLNQRNDVFIPKDDDIKINLIHFENRKPESRKLKIIYYLKPVLDEDEIKSNGKINLEFNKYSNMIILNNISNESLRNKMYVTSSEEIESYTGSKASFLKNTSLSNPDGLDQIELSRENSYGKDGIIAITISVKIDAMSSKDVSISFGSESTLNKCQDISYKYSNISNCREELIKTKKYWNDIVNIVQVDTPIESINIMLNGWLIYQTLTARVFGRTGYYQSGGAYGFRDQLQDMIAVKYFMPEIARKQIIKHANHQFIEGDVEHWWHEETSRGIRTRFSDDLLWLPYVVADYIKYTDDYEILEEKTAYREGKKLDKDVSESYDLYLESNIKETIYEHCIRAIEKSLKFGENGLPLIGSGDWNDGMSNVGTEGKGESVWLGFFMYDVLKQFIQLCEYKGDLQKKEKYLAVMDGLKKSLNTNGWDGRWYKRAFTDNGNVLGSLQNEECRIDSISQSWSVISEAGDNDKKYISMESLENHLVDKENGIIKLLDPPFEKSGLEPGYIKSYIPGTRENGGQYTHGAIWTIIANALLNLNDKALELYRMINPIEHSRTREAANKYKVEPYVMAADVYGQGNLSGRGGWTWYTGASSWMFETGFKYILGINIKDGKLEIQPHVPNVWNEFSLKFKYGKSIYNIKYEKNNNTNKKIKINNEIIGDKEILLNKDGKIYYIIIEI